MRCDALSKMLKFERFQVSTEKVNLALANSSITHENSHMLADTVLTASERIANDALSSYH
jgi:hypothetical protein